VNDYSQIIGIVALAFTLVSAYLVYATAKESTKRALARETASDERANNLQKKADEAIQRAKELEEKSAPRTISQDAGDRIKGILMNFAPVKITVMYANTDAEASHFAGDIESLLTQAKYPYADIPVTVVGDPPGLYFGVNDPANTPLVCPALQKALSDLHIQATWRRDSRVPLGEIGIVVGSKPIQ
jgi:hypothetical protein